MSSSGLGTQQYANYGLHSETEPPPTPLQKDRSERFQVNGPPGWMINNETGLLADFIDPSKIDTSTGDIHILVPSGIGDLEWPWSKLWKVDEMLKEQGRKLVWHVPQDGTQRAVPYLKLAGATVGAALEIDIKKLLSYPGQLEPKDIEEGGVWFVHANRHIEEGMPLHENCPNYGGGNETTWMEWLPFKNPAPPVTMIEGNTPPHTGTDAGVWQYANKAKARKPYVVVHMGNPNYCEGNYMPRQWAKMLEKIETVAPVMLVGAKWDESMINEVCKHYTPAHPVLVGQTLSTVFSRICNSSAIVGVDSGLTITATYYGLAALRGYPRWLQRMPGSFEDNSVLHPVNKPVFMDELYEEMGDWVQRLKDHGIESCTGENRLPPLG
jgi:hypothetical protein